MSLIEDEQDDAALLRAEDEAIRAAELPPEPEGQKATGVPKLIEDVFGETPVQRDGEG